MAHTGTGNHFAFSQAGGQFEWEFAAGFAGQFDPVTVGSTPHAFQIEGGDGAGAATGVDAVAVINGVELSSASNCVHFPGRARDLQPHIRQRLQRNVRPDHRSLLSRSSDSEGTLAFGSDAQATINGQTLAANGSQFEFVDHGRRVNLTFQRGFAGQFDTITAISQSRTISEQISTFQPATPPSLETSPADAVRPIDRD